MSDLIERLRSVPKVWAGHVMHEDGIVPADGRIMHEAADEIERLTAALRADCEARNQKLRAACTALAAKEPK